MFSVLPKRFQSAFHEMKRQYSSYSLFDPHELTKIEKQRYASDVNAPSGTAKSIDFGIVIC